VWNDYFPKGIQGIVFAVDSCNRARFKESKVGNCWYNVCIQLLLFQKEIVNLLADKHFNHCPVLVFGMRSDQEDAADEKELRQLFGFHEIFTGKLIVTS
jgi:hypothetical protein